MFFCVEKKSSRSPFQKGYKQPVVVTWILLFGRSCCEEGNVVLLYWFIYWPYFDQQTFLEHMYHTAFVQYFE